jgi:hypothetical protein
MLRKSVENQASVLSDLVVFLRKSNPLVSQSAEARFKQKPGRTEFTARYLSPAQGIHALLAHAY